MKNFKLCRLKKILPLFLILPACSALADGNSSFDVNSWIALLEQNITYATDIVGGFTVVAGLMFTLAGIDGFHKFGKQRTMMSTNMSLIGPMVKFFAGSVLLTSTSWINTALFSVFGNASPESNIFAGSGDPLAQLYEPAMMIVRLIGIGVFIKMIFTFAKAGSQNPPPGTVGKGLIYLVGSVLCIHIQTTMQLVLSFFGFNSPF